jgi:hypothetical protein
MTYHPIQCDREGDERGEVVTGGPHDVSVQQTPQHAGAAAARSVDAEQAPPALRVAAAFTELASAI